MFSSCVGRLRIGAVLCVWLVGSAPAACSYDTDHGTNLAINVAESPDGQRSAVLVRHIPEGALNNDVYYVMIARNWPASDSAALFKHMEDSAMLVATHARQLQLRWNGERVLRVICAQCGMRTIDVNKKRERYDSVAVIFEGLPPGTAPY